MTINTSRRGFLKGATAAGAVLLVGVRPDGAVAAAPSESAHFNPFVKIDADGTVTAIVKHFEMGHRTFSCLIPCPRRLAHSLFFRNKRSSGVLFGAI